jgi:hypothetical protein
MRFGFEALTVGVGVIPGFSGACAGAKLAGSASSYPDRIPIRGYRIQIPGYRIPIRGYRIPIRR